MADLTPQGHALGLVFGPKDPRTWAFSFTPMASPPPDMDWRPRMRPVGNQASIGSCTGWGFTAAVEAARQDGLQRSPLYLYFRDRQADGQNPPSQDTGATMLAACKALKDYGVPPDALWPYDVSRYNVAPLAVADLAAAQCRVASYYQVQGTGLALLQGLWAALREGPCPIALQVYESFEANVGTNGKVPMPTSRERVLGGHCICACGWFNDNSAPGGYGYVVCQNSWGASMGDGGFYYLPAGYFTAGIVVEAWVVKLAAAPSPEPEDAVDPAIYDELQQALVEASAITGNLDTARYQLRDRDPNTAWTYVGEGSRIQSSQAQRLRRVLELLPPKAEPGPADPPAPEPPTQFVSPVANGGVLGKTKWRPGSLGCDVFVPRGTPLVAPADCIVEEVINGQAINGGAEIILSLPDQSWAWRYRHNQAVPGAPRLQMAPGVHVGSRVTQGQTVASVGDTSLDALGAIPRWAREQADGPFPDGWQHLDLSVNRGTDRFAPTGGGGGNVSAFDWLIGVGYQGRVLARTPGPPDAGFGMEAAIAMMTPAGRQ